MNVNQVPNHVRLQSLFNLDDEDWTLLSSGSVNVLYEVGSRLVVRISLRRSEQHIEEEVRLTELLRNSGFTHVPRFVRTVDGACAVQIAPEAVASVYHYIPGSSQQPLTPSQFATLLALFPGFLDAMKGIDIASFQTRRWFPAPRAALSRARELARIVEVPDPLRPILQDVAWPHHISMWSYDRVIHSDLHARNVIWLNDGRLSGIIDFERFCIGNALIEICALITGTCFIETSLDYDRLLNVVRITRQHLMNHIHSSDMLIDALIIVALYFFGRVNRHLLGTVGVNHSCEWRDALRADELVRRRHTLSKDLDRILLSQ